MTKYQKQQVAMMESIRRLLTTTNLTYFEISVKLGCTPASVYVNARRMGLRRQADKTTNDIVWDLAAGNLDQTATAKGVRDDNDEL